MSNERRHLASDLLNEYFRRIDEGRASSGADLFAESGEMTVFGHTTRGRAELKTALMRREALTERTTRHVVTSVVVQPVEDYDDLRATMLVFRHDGVLAEGELPPASVTMVVDVNARVVHSSDRAELAALTLSTVFDSAEK